MEKFKDIKINFKNIKEDKWIKFFEIKNLIHKEMEKVREKKIVTKSISAKLELNLTKEYINLFSEKEIETVLIFSQVKIKESNNDQNKATISLFEGTKCERCWKSFSKENMFDEQICKRCKKFVDIKK